MYVGVHGGLKFMSDVFLDLSLYLLRHGLFFIWNSPILANLASQLALGNPLSLSSEMLGLQMAATPAQLLCSFWGPQFWVLTLTRLELYLLGLLPIPEQTFLYVFPGKVI